MLPWCMSCSAVCCFASPSTWCQPAFSSSSCWTAGAAAFAEFFLRTDREHTALVVERPVDTSLQRMGHYHTPQGASCRCGVFDTLGARESRPVFFFVFVIFSMSPKIRYLLSSVQLCLCTKWKVKAITYYVNVCPGTNIILFIGLQIDPNLRCG